MSEATTAAAPATGSILDGGAAVASEARAWLPEEYRADPTFKDLADVASLAKGYKHAASLVGVDKADVIRVPREGDIPADVWNRLGRPEAPDGYGFKTEAVPAEVLGTFAQAAHEAGLTKAQAAKVLGFYEQATAATAEARQAQQAETYETNMNALKREWGAAYDDKIHAMKQGVELAGGTALVEKLREAGLANDPDVIKVFVALAEARREPGGLKGGGQGGGEVMTPDAAKEKIANLMRDATFVAKLQNREDPGNADAKRQWDELHEWAYPSTARAA
jgi:hypothetical protein